jgi:MFS family permease
MQSTALGWLALELTDSISFVGLVAFAAGIPFLIVSIPGGLIVDRYDRRKVLLTCQALAATLSISVATAVLTGLVAPWFLLLAAFLTGSLQAVLAPAQQSLIPQILPRHALTNAIGLMSAGQNMTRIFGPSLAGAVIGLFGTGQAFILQSFALAIAMALVATAAFPKLERAATVMNLNALLEGGRIVRERSDLRSLFLLTALPTFFIFPYLSFLTVFARDILKIGPEGLGLLMASSGVGAVAGSLWVASKSATASGKLLITQALLYSTVIFTFSLVRSLWIVLPLLVAAGALGSSFWSATNAQIQHRISDEYRGRVMGIYMLTFGLMPLGTMPMGLISARIGTPTTLAISAFICMALIIWLGASSRDLREL